MPAQKCHRCARCSEAPQRIQDDDRGEPSAVLYVLRLELITWARGLGVVPALRAWVVLVLGSCAARPVACLGRKVFHLAFVILQCKHCREWVELYSETRVNATTVERAGNHTK
jgi:hypothetical protein